MASPLPRTRFNSSNLVRVLTDLGVVEAGEPKQSLGERLGQWLDLNDAISLSAALKSGASSSPGSATEPAPRETGVGGELARVRAILADAILAEEGLKAGAPGESPSADDFSPYHRYYLARQRDMDGKIVPLRASVRTALARCSPRLRQLAALDAVMEEALRARERSLLGNLPLLLEKRFDQLREAAGAAEGRWVPMFRRDLKAMLLAELELRLQPVAGLVEATGIKVQQ